MRSARKSITLPESGVGLKGHSRKFIQFCIVGGSGVFVDMGLFGFLADPYFLGIHITTAKIIAASAAMLSNYALNEFWTFQESGKNRRYQSASDPHLRALSSRIGQFPRHRRSPKPLLISHHLDLDPIPRRRIRNHIGDCISAHRRDLIDRQNEIPRL